jgi:hydroxymethylpyrimidine/phosphomethylpyrimidine kinase
MKVALTIAGSDSGGGAGIQADIKAMQANGVFAASVLTAVTAQNTRAVLDAYELPLDLIEKQIDAVFDDIRIDAVKTGMLASVPVIDLVARKLKQRATQPVVVDPVMISKSGYSLLQPDAVDALRRMIAPLATVITPNAHEASHLAEIPVRTLDDAREAASRIYKLGPKAVLVKGGHLENSGEATDVLYDGQAFYEFSTPYIQTAHTHGTGCTYASAIAANLARGYALHEAIGRAKRYMEGAIRHALDIGGGHGPTHHFYYLEGSGIFPVADA